MTKTTENKPALWFWIVSAVALVWNLLGVMAFIAMSIVPIEQITEQYGQEFADVFSGKPAWATGAFAIAVFSGALGSFGLLLRKAWAKWLFILSLVGIIIHDIWGVMAGTLAMVGTFDKVMTVAVVAIAIALIWFSKKSISNGWIK